MESKFESSNVITELGGSTILTLVPAFSFTNFITPSADLSPSKSIGFLLPLAQNFIVGYPWISNLLAKSLCASASNFAITTLSTPLNASPAFF